MKFLRGEKTSNPTKVLEGKSSVAPNLARDCAKPHSRLAVAIIPTMKPSRSLLAFVALSMGFFDSQSAVAQTKAATTPTQAATVQVPFVGCPSDGQAGPIKVPAGSGKAVAISAALAPRLAYYKAEYGIGVLAPRGWHCFSTYGSDGSNLFVSASPIDPKVPFAADWKGLSGEAIQVSVSSGGTSGRFQVARVIARVFPAYQAFAQNVIAEGIVPASSFPSGPYPNDKLTYRGKNIVEFETPANAAGLGTNSRLQVGPIPIDGVAVISGADTDLTQLSARLAGNNRDLIQIIINQVELEAAAPSVQ
jgi:hypothetical protein